MPLTNLNNTFIGFCFSHTVHFQNATELNNDTVFKLVEQYFQHTIYSC